jgi:4-amino-4-deoxy-L-arabinose transferase-like glycosyltransferase
VGPGHSVDFSALRRRWPRALPFGKGIAFLLLAGIALRLATASLHHVVPVSDFLAYHSRAATLVERGEYIGAYWPPGWPFILSSIYAVFGVNATAGAVFAATLSCATLVITALMAVHLLKPVFALAAVAVLALNPAWIAYTSVLGTEHLAALLVVSILALVTLGPLGSWRAIVIGLLTALLVLTRADIGFAVIITLAVVVLVRGVRTYWRFAAITAGAVAVGLTPWIVRNESKYHEFVPTSTNGGTTFYLASYTVNGLDLPQPDPPPSVSVAEHPRAYDNYYWRLGLRHVRDDPIAWMGFNAKRLKITWLYEGELWQWANVSWSPARQVADWIFRVLMLLAAWAGVAALTGRISWRRWLPIFTMVTCTILITAPFVPQPRRHVPVAPLIALLAALGAESLYGEALRFRRLGSRRRPGSPARRS